MIVITALIVYNSKRRKTKKFNKALNRFDQFLNNLKLKI